jgi:hypothetical protein
MNCHGREAVYFLGRTSVEGNMAVLLDSTVMMCGVSRAYQDDTGRYERKRRKATLVDV